MILMSPHTCGGPLLYICSTHLATALPDFLIMESNYWKYAHQYPYFVNNVPVPNEGHVIPELPGIGAEINPELFQNGDAFVETVATIKRPAKIGLHVKVLGLIPESRFCSPGFPTDEQLEARRAAMQCTPIRHRREQSSQS